MREHLQVVEVLAPASGNQLQGRRRVAESPGKRQNSALQAGEPAAPVELNPGHSLWKGLLRNLEPSGRQAEE
ncbi:hypothetical protein SAMN06269301_1324 [Geobacter sp. DSM 9736]|nr:hypothetical protein SAMN06269301_1324 [Geobacter sp. DSM 9736]